MDDGVAVWICHHCEEKGSTRLENTDLPFMQDHYANEPSENYNRPAPILGEFEELTDEQIGYLSKRGISAKTAEKIGIISQSKFIRSREGKFLCLGFVYKNLDGSQAVKFRDAKKNFLQAGAAKSFWRIEEFKEGDLVITEGEMDAASFEEIGTFATSVPNGAPQKVVDDPDPLSKKYMYLAESEEFIKKASRVIIATDSDGPGEALAEEIARRIGKSRCWRLHYPDGCKDANEVLMKHGADVLKESLKDATPWPIGGLRQASEYADSALKLYRDGMSHAVDISIGGIDKIFKPAPGTLAIFTGIPGSGKSTLTTWLSYVLASQHDWQVGVFAAETSSQVHLLQLAALRCGKPFMGADKMSEVELTKAFAWINERFVFLDESETSVDSILDRGQAAIMRNGCRLLVIDPFNFLSGESRSSRDDDGSTQGINRILVKLKSFAVEHDVAIWLVAHPKKMERFQGKNHTPGGYDISGSAHFFNVADNGITVERDGQEPWVSKVVSWKSRFPWVGSLGSTKLSLDKYGTGSYSKVLEWGDHPNDFNTGSGND